MYRTLGAGTCSFLGRSDLEGETLPVFWWCTEHMLTVPGENGWEQLVGDGRDMTLVMHKGTELEDAFAKVGILPNPQSAMNPEFKRECHSIARVSLRQPHVSSSCMSWFPQGELLFSTVSVNS